MVGFRKEMMVVDSRLLLGFEMLCGLLWVVVVVCGALLNGVGEMFEGVVVD